MFGNIGVGTTNPTARLQIIRDGVGSSNTSLDGSQLILSRTVGNAENIAFRNTGASNGISGTNYAGQIVSYGNNILEIYTNVTNPIIFGTDATERMRITPSGSIEIGNTGFSSPSGADRFIGVYGAQDSSLILQDAVQLWELYVNDDFYINRGSTNVLTLNRTTGAATFSSSVTAGGQTSVLYSGYDSNVEGLRLGFDASYYNAISATFSSTAANNKMNFVVNSGNGTRAIAMTLQGNGNVGIGTASPTNLITLQKLGSVSTTPGIDFRGTLSLGGVYNDLDYNSGRIYGTFDSSVYASARVTIATPTGVGTFQDVLTVKDKNVGIGTTSPASLLSIQRGASGDNMELIGSGASGYSDILFYNTNKVSRLGYIDWSDTQVRWNVEANVPLVLYTNATERVRINQYGQLLINATSSTYSTNLYGYNLGVRGNTNQTFISIARSNQSLDSEGMIIGLDTTKASIFVHDNIPLAFHTNSTERVRITSGGSMFNRASTAGHTAFIGAIGPGNVGNRYLHVRINTIVNMMVWIKVFGYAYTVGNIEGLSGCYIDGGTGAVAQSYQNGSIVAQHQNSNYLEIVVDTVSTATTNRWGSISFMGGTDNLTTIQPLEIIAYSWTSTTTRVY